MINEYLQSSLGIAIPIETHFIPHFQKYLGLWGDLRVPHNASSLIKALTTYTRLWIFFGIRSQNPHSQVSVSLLPALETLISDRKTINALCEQMAGPNDFATILDHLYQTYASQFGLENYGDKSAPFDPEQLSAYEAAFGNIRVIHIVRDGRDVRILERAMVWT